MVEVVFLGTGGAFITEQRTNLALLIEQPGFRMLVEAGPPVMYQLARAGYKAADIEHLFVSHLHGDHTLGFPMLALNRIDSPKLLQVYAAHSTIRQLGRLWETAYPDLDKQRVNIKWHRRPEDRAEASEIAPGVTLETRPLPHHPGVVTLGARWEFADGLSIAFVTDTVPSPATVELARNCTLLIHEASFSAVLQSGYDPSAHYHSTAQQAGEMARQAGAHLLALVHLGPAIADHPDVLIEEAQAGSELNVIVPADGERLTLQVCKSAGLQVCRCASLQVCRFASSPPRGND